MIGQEKLKTKLSEYNKLFPLTILFGSEGMGKKTLIREVFSNNSMYDFIECENKVEEVREMIDLSYNMTKPTMIAIYMDNVNNRVCNALLKIVEEPPKYVKFIITCIDKSIMPATLKTRGYILNMYPYTVRDIISRIEEKGATNYIKELIVPVCNNIQDVDLILQYNVKEFMDYVENVFKHINRVSMANALKIGSKISFSGEYEEGKYDSKLFLQTFAMLCAKNVINAENIFHNYPFFYNLLQITSDTINKYHLGNKKQLFNLWLASAQRTKPNDTSKLI